MNLHQVWDMGELIDLGGDIYEGMTQVPPPLFPAVQVREIDLSTRAKGRGYMSYSQSVILPVQVSTYLETGAHLYPEMEKVHEVGLDRLFLSAVVLQIPRGPGEKVTAPDIESELSKVGEVVNPGEALLVATGYNLFDEVDFKNSPHFRYDAVEWAVQRKCALIGSDMGNWQDPDEKPHFFPMFLKSGTMLLAPMVNLTRVRAARIKLIVMPLKIRGACASPCRVIGVVPASGRDMKG
jgi:kynurenine formamidase